MCKRRRGGKPSDTGMWSCTSQKVGAGSTLRYCTVQYSTVRYCSSLGALPLWRFQRACCHFAQWNLPGASARQSRQLSTAVGPHMIIGLGPTNNGYIKTQHSTAQHSTAAYTSDQSSSGSAESDCLKQNAKLNPRNLVFAAESQPRKQTEEMPLWLLFSMAKLLQYSTVQYSTVQYSPVESANYRDLSQVQE